MTAVPLVQENALIKQLHQTASGFAVTLMMTHALNGALHNYAQQEHQAVMQMQTARKNARTNACREKKSVLMQLTSQTFSESAEILMMTHALNGEKQKHALKALQAVT